MKLTNEDLLGFLVAIGQLKTRKMPAKLAWKLSASEKLMKPFAEAFEKATEELREKYAAKDEDGKPKLIKDANGVEAFDIPEENKEAANKEFKDLLKAEFEATPVELTLDDFPDTLEVTPEIMGLLDPVMELGKSKKK